MFRRIIRQLRCSLLQAMAEMLVSVGSAMQGRVIRILRMLREDSDRDVRYYAERAIQQFTD
jgi:hypothetical protein